jgi:hypothetical protein
MCSPCPLPPPLRATATQVVLARSTDQPRLTDSWFHAVGMVLGAVTGALIGLATESGLVRGAGIGSISGAVVSMEVVDSSVAIWRSDESGIWSVLYVVRNNQFRRFIPNPISSFTNLVTKDQISAKTFQLDVLWSLLTGRLVREKVDPAVQSAVDSQVSTKPQIIRSQSRQDHLNRRTSSLQPS